MGGGGRDRGAQGREGQLALCLHAVPGWEAGVCPTGDPAGILSVTRVQNGEEVQGVLDFVSFCLGTWPPICIARPQLALSVVQAGIDPIRLRGARGGARGRSREAGSQSKARGGWHTSRAKGPSSYYKYYRSLANPELYCLAVNIPLSVYLVSPLFAPPPSPSPATS